MSDALRTFGLVDAFRLRDLIETYKLPTRTAIIEQLRSGTRSLPPSISADFVADVILASLKEADAKSKPREPARRHFDLKQFKPGRTDAGRYHKSVFEALKFVLSPPLRNGVIERNVDQGRKRIDVLFENPATRGFFRRLQSQHGIFCPLIFVECKNYSHDPENPEFDQLIARFHDRRGRFGILVCRKIENPKLNLARCGDVIGGGTGYIIVLEDTDIYDLVDARNSNDLRAIDDFLSKKLTEALLNAK